VRAFDIGDRETKTMNNDHFTEIASFDYEGHSPQRQTHLIRPHAIE
jgi:hypothetical protein